VELLLLELLLLKNALFDSANAAAAFFANAIIDTQIKRC
jgi:hypothetical protein